MAHLILPLVKMALLPSPDFGDESSYDKIKLEPDGSLIIAGNGQTDPYAIIPAYMILCHISADGTFDYKFGNGGSRLRRLL